MNNGTRLRRWWSDLAPRQRDLLRCYVDDGDMPYDVANIVASSGFPPIASILGGPGLWLPTRILEMANEADDTNLSSITV